MATKRARKPVTRKPARRRTASGLPAFMRDPEAAFEWARRTQPCLRDQTGDIVEEGWGDELRDRAYEYVEGAAAIAASRSVTVYRALRVPLVEDPRDVIDFGCIGAAWSKEWNGAEVLERNQFPEPTERIVLEGRVAPRYVDWKTGLLNRALSRCAFDRERLREMAARYGTPETQARLAGLVSGRDGDVGAPGRGRPRR
jgi:hypothetical protein